MAKHQINRGAVVAVVITDVTGGLLVELGDPGSDVFIEYEGEAGVAYTVKPGRRIIRIEHAGYVPPQTGTSNINIGGSVSGGNVNLGGKQTFHGSVNVFGNSADREFNAPQANESDETEPVNLKLTIPLDLDWEIIEKRITVLSD